MSKSVVDHLIAACVDTVSSDKEALAQLISSLQARGISLSLTTPESEQPESEYVRVYATVKTLKGSKRTSVSMEKREFSQFSQVLFGGDEHRAKKEIANLLAKSGPTVQNRSRWVRSELLDKLSSNKSMTSNTFELRA